MKLPIMMLAIFMLSAASEGYDEELMAPRASYKTVHSAQILDEIVKGLPTNYSGVIIIDDLDISRDPHSTNIINSSLRITNSEILGDVKFDNIVFNGILDFSGTVFRKNVSFCGSNFQENAIFNKCKYENGANFVMSKFHRKALFWRAIINEEAKFGFASFYDNVIFTDSILFSATFYNASFNKDANFQNSSFFNDAEMNNVSFGSIVDFASTQFHGRALFHNSIFKGRTNIQKSIKFYNTVFEYEAFFKDALFLNEVTFEDSRFIEDANFEGVKFQSNADFIKTKFKGDAVFWEAIFSKNLSLNYARFSNFKARWEDLDGHLIFGEILYSSLIKSFKDLGRTNDANECYYEYRVEHARSLESSTKLFDFISWISCGYGVRPSYTIYWIIGLTVLFGFFLWLINGIEEPKSPNAAEEPHNNSNKLAELIAIIQGSYAIKCLYFSTAVIIAARSAEYYIIKDKFKSLIILHRVLGWFFFALFIAAMTRTMMG